MYYFVLVIKSELTVAYTNPIKIKGAHLQITGSSSLMKESVEEEIIDFRTWNIGSTFIYLSIHTPKPADGRLKS
jgi:hypothetical protein